MSQPNEKAELHEAVEEFVKGDTINAVILHREIDGEKEQTFLYREFIENINDLNNKHR